MYVCINVLSGPDVGAPRLSRLQRARCFVLVVRIFVVVLVVVVMIVVVVMVVVVLIC